MVESADYTATTAAHPIAVDNVANAETIGGHMQSTAEMFVPGTVLARPDLVGLDGYEIIEPLRKFKHGTVYAARHKSLDRKVALRILEGAAASDPEIRSTFLKSANACSAMNHPNLGTILEAYEGEQPFVAEEYFDGSRISGFGPRTVAERRQEFLFPNRQLAGYMLQAAAGLDCLHKHGASACPLTVDRVLVNDREQVKIVGLGEERIDPPPRSPNVKSDSPQTRDLISLGEVFSQLTSGVVDEAMDRGQTVRERNPGISKALADIIEGLKKANLGSAEASAEGTCIALQSLVQRRLASVPTWTRMTSICADALTVAILMLTICGILALLSVFSSREGEISAAILLWSIPVLYFVGPGTPSRRTYGLLVVGVDGEKPRWRPKLIREGIRLGWHAILLAIIVGIVFAVAGSKAASANAGWILVAGIVGIPVAAFTLYMTRWLTPTRMPLHEVYSDTRLVHVENVLEAADSSTQLPVPVKYASDADPGALNPVETVDQYQLLQVIGAGGMGQVYLARDSVLGRNVAFKVMASRCMVDDVEIQRFEREARLAATLSHPNIAKAFDFGRWGAQPYVVVEYVDGLTLQEMVKIGGKMPIGKAWNYVMQAAQGLREADRAGIVHRDIKPSNLIVAQTGMLKVVDFGIARKSAGDEGLTRTGTFVGTPKYMSPEQATGKDVDCRSDIYSLGMTLYHLLAGSAPFDKGNPMEILAQQLSEEPPCLMGKVHGLTEERHTILKKMLAKKREERFANHDELLDALQRESPANVTFAEPKQRLKAEFQNWFALILAVGLYLIGSLELLSMFLPSDNEAVVKTRFAMYWWVARLGVVGITIAFALTYIAGIARWGRTFGKWATGVRILRSDGQRVRWWRATARLFAVYPFLLVAIPGWFFSSVEQIRFARIGIVGWAMLFNLVWLAVSAIYGMRSPRGQMLHDRWLDTVAIRTPRWKLKSLRQVAAKVKSTNTVG